MNEDVKKIVYEQLITVADNVHYQEVPENSALPYVVFSFPSDGRKYKDQVVSDLQIDIYDVDRDGYNVSREIDKLTDEVERVFDYQSFAEGETYFWMKRNIRQAIPFPSDVNLWARQLVFETRIYRRTI